ncbi:S41 family peptidase [uncultured Sphingobacterium sp.]|uniref:S41 family peptidase n=1 Tax=uncultured Sphingobacterium sp. TaxID=182688 RepID=UPI0025D871A0|nr:S41 family peptidase [uncultured Sphingobacterium sp.]
MIIFRRNKIIFVAITLFITVCACKKDLNDDENVSPTTGSRTELTIDSLFLYAKEIYLWNDILPNYKTFSPREKYTQIGSEINALNAELFDISQLKINENTKLPFEYSYTGTPRYSYLETNFNHNIKAGIKTISNTKNSDIIVSYNNSVAYLAISSFPKLDILKTGLDNIFIDIAKNHPSTIILDLRYNRGGYIETTEYLANLIAPSKLNGRIMYTEKFNDVLSTGNTKILKYQPYLDNNGNYVKINGRQATMADIDFSEKGNTYHFSKKGKLESIENIYFITSGSTASASELLISLFKPYFNVKTVGQKTFGKPVGFFPIDIDRYSLYLSSFLLKNADGWFDYFNGIEPNIIVDLPSSPILGDPDEIGFRSILFDLGTSRKHASKTKDASPKIKKIKIETNLLPKETLSIENRFKLK